MRAIEISKFGEASETVSFTTSRPKPSLTKEHQVLVKVHAVSLSPGDVRIVKGQTRLVQKPDKFPYVPGGDLCGTVVQNAPESLTLQPKFKVGDIILSQFKVPLPFNALAEYAVVDERWSVLKPSNLSVVEGAALATSQTAGYLAVKNNARPGDRVLVIGGSGGVGMAAIQCAKRIGKASYVAAVSTQEELLLGLGADRVIDYTKENVWEMQEYLENPFDMVIDLVGGPVYSKVLCNNKCLKPGKQGGRYVALAGIIARPVIHNVWHLVKFLRIIVKLPIRSKCFPSTVPKYSMASLLDIKANEMEAAYTELVGLYGTGDLQVVVDGEPYEFSKEGFLAAYNKQNSLHAHGKVVILIDDSTLTND